MTALTGTTVIITYYDGDESVVVTASSPVEVRRDLNTALCDPDGDSAPAFIGLQAAEYDEVVFINLHHVASIRLVPTVLADSDAPPSTPKPARPKSRSKK